MCSVYALQIWFVAYEINAFFRDILLEGFVYVVFAFLQGLRSGEIVNADASLTSFVVGGSKGSEFLLACSIPNLQRIRMLAHLGVIGFEINADSGQIVRIEGWLG